MVQTPLKITTRHLIPYIHKYLHVIFPFNLHSTTCKRQNLQIYQITNDTTTSETINRIKARKQASTSSQVSSWTFFGHLKQHKAAPQKSKEDFPPLQPN